MFGLRKKSKDRVKGLGKDESLPAQKPPSISLLGGGLKGPEQPSRFYPGDLVCFRGSKPLEWQPWYGVVLSPNSPVVKYVKQKEKNDLPQAELSNSKPESGTTEKTSNSGKSASVFAMSEEPEASLHQSEDVEGEGDSYVKWSAESGLPTPIYVHWSRSNSIAPVNDLSEIVIVDRNLIRGQRVRNEDGVSGVVVDVKIKGTLQVLNTNHVFDNVPIQDLKPVSPFVRGREIQYKGWIGVITKVRRNVTCRLDQGGYIFSLRSNESDGFMKSDLYWGPGMPCPGIRNHFVPSVMKSAHFNSGMMRFIHRYVPPVSYLYTRSQSTTVGVETLNIEVMWLERCPSSTDPSEEAPPPETIMKAGLREVKPLGLPNHETIGLNSVRMYAIKSDDAVISYQNWYAGFHAKFFGGPATNFAQLATTPSKNNLLSQGFEVPVKIIYRQAEVEVEWETGNSEYMLASRAPILLPSAIGSSEFQAGLVVESVLEPYSKKYGVVLNAEDPSTHFAKVRWILPGSEEDETEDLGVKNESVYDIKTHPSISLPHRGTTVFIKNHPLGYQAGTVVDWETRRGQLFLAVPGTNEALPVYPHTVAPLNIRSHWNFHARSWIIESLLPSTCPMLEDVGVPEDKRCALSLTTPNFGNNAKVRPQDIFDCPTFAVLDSPPEYHRFAKWKNENPSEEFLRAIQKELKNVNEATLPEGIWVRGYESRNDLYSAVLLGPEKTPYEDGLYFFDIQIPEGFPSIPPRIHHIPYTTNPVSAFVSIEGVFCTSKLKWKFAIPPQSYLPVLLGQVQDMIFSTEPYFDQYGRADESGTPEGQENSRLCNERIVMNVLTSFFLMATSPYDPWRFLISKHLSLSIPYKVECVKEWTQSESGQSNKETKDQIQEKLGYNLLPVSEGFRAAVAGRLRKLEELMPSADDGAEDTTRPTTAQEESENSSVKSEETSEVTLVEEETEVDVTDVAEIISVD